MTGDKPLLRSKMKLFILFYSFLRSIHPSKVWQPQWQDGWSLGAGQTSVKTPGDLTQALSQSSCPTAGGQALPLRETNTWPHSLALNRKQSEEGKDWAWIQVGKVQVWGPVSLERLDRRRRQINTSLKKHGPLGTSCEWGHCSPIWVSSIYMYLFTGPQNNK